MKMFKSLVVAMSLISVQSFAAEIYPSCDQLKAKIGPIAMLAQSSQIKFMYSDVQDEIKIDLQNLSNQMGKSSCPDLLSAVKLCSDLQFAFGQIGFDDQTVQTTWVSALRDYGNIFPDHNNKDAKPQFTCDLKNLDGIKAK